MSECLSVCVVCDVCVYARARVCDVRAVCVRVAVVMGSPPQELAPANDEESKAGVGGGFVRVAIVAGAEAGDRLDLPRDDPEFTFRCPPPRLYHFILSFLTSHSAPIRGHPIHTTPFSLYSHSTPTLPFIADTYLTPTPTPDHDAALVLTYLIPFVVCRS